MAHLRLTSGAVPCIDPDPINDCFVVEKGRPAWWVGATLFDHEGNKCYTYQRLDKPPEPEVSTVWRPALGRYEQVRPA